MREAAACTDAARGDGVLVSRVLGGRDRGAGGEEEGPGLKSLCHFEICWSNGRSCAGAKQVVVKQIPHPRCGRGIRDDRTRDLARPQRVDHCYTDSEALRPMLFYAGAGSPGLLKQADLTWVRDFAMFLFLFPLG